MVLTVLNVSTVGRTMERRNLEAMGRGREYMLARFVNLPVAGTPGLNFKYMESPCVKSWKEALKAIDEFRDQFGEPRPHMERDNWLAYILTFRYHWHWRRNMVNREVVRRPLRVALKTRGENHKKQQIEIDDASAWCTFNLNCDELS